MRVESVQPIGTVNAGHIPPAPTCKVCKQVIAGGDSYIAVPSGGFVHTGYCKSFLSEVATSMNESAGASLIQETQLLM